MEQNIDKYSARRFDVHGEEAIDHEILETMPYAYPGRETIVEYYTEEFTAVCPWTGLPDFALLSIKYVPRERLIELKSLKYYLLSYRNVGILQEHVVNRVLQDLVKVCNPVKMQVEAEFHDRGGLGTRVAAAYNW
ncbi:MAG: preQ(1) synthase [Firmicutes bacterium]|nr:preQ(1) synthase [Bacillota bacterium]